MDDRNKYYLEIYIAENAKDLKKKMEFFNSITNCLFELTNSLFENKIQIKYHEQILESKFYRIAIANNTLMQIMRGNRIQILDETMNLTDIDSLFSITRMQIESFLILFYLVFDDADHETKDFRLNIYKLHALQKQNNFKLSENFIDTENQRGKISQEIDEVILAIKQSSIFLSANASKQKEYLKPNYAKLCDSKQLFLRSGILKSRIDLVWSIYSNYAHSEYISDRQHNYRKQNPNSIASDLSLILDINKILSSRLVIYLKDLYPENLVKYDSFETKDKVYIETWSKI